MEFPIRKPTRLPGYDYSKQNYYYVTLCSCEKRCIFGAPNKLNVYGKIAESELINIEEHFSDVKIDKYVVMPNHIHAIVIIGCTDNSERSRPFPTLSSVIGLYKAGVSRRVHELNPNAKIWQKSFYDHIIRNDKSYIEIWRYIDENPLKWDDDELYAK